MSVQIASRASWGACYVNGVGTRPVGSLQKYLHHTVTRHLPANATVAQERAQMRVVERIGQERFGRGISYTILIFPSGRLYWGAGITRISYHSGGGRDGKPRNTIGVGICLVGNYETAPMTAAQEASLVAVLRHGVEQGWWQDAAITEGHRDFKSTSCPGRHAYGRIPSINRAARSGGTPNAPTGGKDWLNMVSDQEFYDRIHKLGEDLRSGFQADIERMVGEAVWTFVTSTEPRSGWTMLRRAVEAAQATNAALAGIAGKVGAPVDVDALAHSLAEPLTEALTAALAESGAPGTPMTGETVERALRRVFADAGRDDEEVGTDG